MGTDSGRWCMRDHGLALALALLCGAPLWAQQPQAPAAPAAPALDPARNRLDALLLQWEQRMKTVQALSADCIRTTVDKTFNTTEDFEGTARYMKPDLAMLDMHKRN